MRAVSPICSSDQISTQSNPSALPNPFSIPTFSLPPFVSSFSILSSSPSPNPKNHSQISKRILKKKSQKKLLILRGLLFFALVLAGGLSGGLSYYFIKKYQNQTTKRHFDTMIEDHFRSLQKLLHIQLHLNIQWAIDFGLACPSLSDWPNCVMSSKEIHSRTKSLLTVSTVTQFVYLPIVHPENRSSFEKFALDYYATDGAYPNGTGYYDLGAGIYDRDENNLPFRSPNHTDPNTSQHDFLLPMFLATNIAEANLLYNAYSDPSMKKIIDEILDCVNRTRATNSSDTGSYKTQHQCSISIDLSDPLSSQYSSIILSPVFADDDPYTVVAFTGAVFEWESALNATPYQEFEFRVSVECSASSTIQSYLVEHGKISKTKYLKTGNPRTRMKRSFTLQPEASSQTENFYTITYYSSHNSSAEFFPIVTCLCCLGVTLLISLIFFGYIVLSDRESLAMNMLLDSKRTYVRFISHEIRTPLNTIHLSTRILCENINQLQDILSTISPSLSPQQANVCAPLHALVEECLGLIVDLEENSSVAVATLSDLINYDKIESKTFTIEKKDVNVWSVLEKTIQPLSLQAKEKNIEMELKTHLSHPSDFGDVDVNPQHLRLVGDSIKLGQVIRNLVSNALKFTPANGTVKISASFEPNEIPHIHSRASVSLLPSAAPPKVYSEIATEASVGRIVITVTDTGPGLTLEQQDAMFQEGVQFNPNELQAGQGSGLGLWISKEIVSLHDGDITVRSRGLGMGTTFVVKLPVLLRDNVLPMNPSLTNPLPAPVLSPTPQSPVAFSAICADAPLHVLVVDDAISNRKLVCRLLQSKGFICHQAENGQECVNMMLAGGHHHPFDLILMDYEMPIMNGPSAARKLREMKSEILIIGLTGNVLPEDKEYFLDHGANAVLTKPVDLNELLECIRVHRSTGSSAV